MASGREPTRELLGKGALTTTFTVWDALLGRSVAIQELNAPYCRDAACIRTFASRSQGLFDLDDEHTLRIYRIDTARQTPAVVREVADETLAALVAAAPLAPAEVETILRQTLAGLRAYHERGIVHGAIAPHNLFRCGGTYKVGDFGLAGFPGFETPPGGRFTAPEMLGGEAPSYSSDLYSLGRVVWDLLSAEPRPEPIGDEDLSRFRALIPGTPSELARTIHWMTRRVVSERAGDAGQVLDSIGESQPARAVSPALASRSSLHLDSKLRPPESRRAFNARKLKRGLTVGLSGVVALSIGAAILYLRGQRPTEAAPPAVAEHVALAVEPTPERAGPGRGGGIRPVPPVPSPPPGGPVATLTIRAPSLPAIPGPLHELPASAKSSQPLEPWIQKVQAQPGSVTVELRVPAANSRRRADLPDPKEKKAKKRAGKGAEVILNLQPSSYGLGSLANDRRAYVDLSSAYSEVPEAQAGIPCIETSAAGSPRQPLSFTLSRGARVYVGYDQGIRDRPAWLKEFQPTGNTWSVLVYRPGRPENERVHYDVYMRRFPAGPVTLGPNLGRRSLWAALRRAVRRSKPRNYLVCVDAR